MTTAADLDHEEGDKWVERVENLFEWRCIMVVAGLPIDIGVATTMEERNAFLADGIKQRRGRRR